MSLLAAAAALITAIVAGGLSIALVQRTSADNAQKQLAQLANVTQTTTEVGASATASAQRARRTLNVLKIDYASVGPAGRVVSDSPLARDAVTPAMVTALLAGESVSQTARVDGQSVYIEGRTIATTGAIVLVQKRSDAVAVGQRAVRWILLALVIAVVLAIGLALFVARRLARPLKRTAAAAHALAAGQRDVIVYPEGPEEVAEVADAVNALASSLSHSEAREREFLLSISHDLRTPLTTIGGYAESLADGMIAPERTQEVGAVLLAESQRLSRLVADLLDLARLGAQEFRIDVIDLDILAFARTTAAVWAARCGAVGVRFVLDAPAGSVLVRTDPTRLRQALDGLFDNALRLTPAGAAIVLAVRPMLGPDNPWVAVEVRDGGPGLSDADLAVAFERSALYDRYRGVRPVGTGLGLAIVHALVTRLGATIEAGHAAEGGARFTIGLPAVR
jgi:two-component system, OmpR family, sensor kinase